MVENGKPDVVLSDGTKVFFDKHRIKPREWRECFSNDQSPEDGERVIARFAGLDYDGYACELSLHDWQLLFAGARAKVLEPVVPNLPSVSISPS
jgi:hypothetical protein